MTESIRSGTSGLKDTLAGNPATGRLKEAASEYAAAQAQRLLVATGQKLGQTTARLNDVSANGGGVGSILGTTVKDTLKTAVKENVKGKAKDTLKGAVKSLTGKRGGGGGSGKFMTITETIDVGVPVREAYNQWTQYQEFSTFTKGVQGVEVTDDTTTNWRAKILWSTRSWTAKTMEQIPDERIAWNSEGPKGTVKGVVTFHELADNLTRVLLIIEYYPQGLFEKTGNIWRAQGRRARLDLKHFQRFVMMRGEATGEWRGEIRDGEVVRGPEEEEKEGEERDEYEEEPEGEYEEDEDEEEPGPEDEDEQDGPEDEYEDEDEDEEEPEGTRADEREAERIR